jgi:predicted NBD/HSP70 family sugar kinase
VRPQRNVLRRQSERSVVDALMNRGPISRAALAVRTGLSKQTISEIVRDLEAEGLVIERGLTSGAVGRTAITYELVASAAHVLAVDLGGAEVTVGAADLTGAIVGRVVERTDRRGGAQVIDQVARLARTVMTQAQIRPGSARVAVVGVPGAPEPGTGRVRLAPHVRGLEGIDVVGGLARALDCEVMLDNDVNLATWGEAWRGAGQGIDHLVYVALGSGIGCGLMIDGKLLRGADNAAGEMGFLPLGADPVEARSRRIGAFERAVAFDGIRARYAAAGGGEADVAAILDRAEAGEAAARAAVDETGRLLAAGIAAVCAIVNPRKVVLGGPIGARAALLDRVRAALPIYFHSPVEVAAGALGPGAVLSGAVAAGLGRLHGTLFGGEVGAERIALPAGRAATAPDGTVGRAAPPPAHRTTPGALAPVSAKPGRQT